MISKLSEKAVDMFFSHSALSHEDKELYIYGFFLLLSKAFFFLLTVIFGALFGIAVESALFFILFSVLRSYAGGIHASKESSCTIFTTLAILASVALIRISINYSLSIPTISLLILSASIILLLCPLDSAAKQLTREEKRMYRKKAIFCTIVILMFSVLFLALRFHSLLYVCAISLGLESILLLIGKCAEKKSGSSP